METADNKSKIANRIFYTVLILLILGSVGFTYWRIVVVKDYQIIAETACNPFGAACFIRDPEPCAENDAECLANPSTEETSYKLISKSAASIYACELKKFASEEAREAAGCGSNLVCQMDEPNCTYTLCNDDNVPEGESCSTKYKK